MDTFVDMYHTLRDMRKRQMAHQVLNLAMIVCSALMIWKSLMVVTSSESPVVVVLSGSMEPAFHRGDILFLHMGFTPFRAGDIVVFKVADREIPIVHRVIKVHEKESGEVDMLTKGDNNQVDDRGLYAASQSWINREHVIGRAKGYLPYVSNWPLLKLSFPACGVLHTQFDLTLVPRTPRCADWDGDHHHERLPDREVHLGRPDGPFRPHNKRITMQQSSELFVLRPRASTCAVRLRFQPLRMYAGRAHVKQCAHCCCPSQYRVSIQSAVALCAFSCGTRCPGRAVARAAPAC